MVLTKSADVAKQGFCTILWRKLRLREGVLLSLIGTQCFSSLLEFNLFRLHVTTTCTDKQTCLPCVYIKRHYVLTNVVRALMAHPMENRINLFSLIRGSLYAYLRSTIRGNIRHDTRAPETGVPFMSLFCFAYPRLRLAFLYIYFLK